MEQWGKLLFNFEWCVKEDASIGKVAETVRRIRLIDKHVTAAQHEHLIPFLPPYIRGI